MIFFLIKKDKNKLVCKIASRKNNLYTASILWWLLWKVMLVNYVCKKRLQSVSFEVYIYVEKSYVIESFTSKKLIMWNHEEQCSWRVSEWSEQENTRLVYFAFHKHQNLLLELHMLMRTRTWHKKVVEYLAMYFQ